MRLMKATDPRVTFAELQQWPDDGRRYELYDGEVIVVPSPVPRHQRIVLNLAWILREYEERAGGLVFAAPLDIVFDEHNVVQPDVLYFREEQRPFVPMDAAAHATPDLAIEVLSRRTAVRDRGRKMQLLARFAVPEYWIVDPDSEAIEIYALHGAAYDRMATAGAGQDAQSATLTGLSFPVARVFEP
jgi:Uma2 family endonuclease